jgi:hypothetical protein
MAIDWRTWLYQKVVAFVGDKVGNRVFQSLDEDETPDEKPFIVLRFGTDVPEVVNSSEGVQSLTGVIWVHDNPGSYLLIDAILRELREEMAGAVVEADGISSDWLGDSPDLADDMRKTIVRNATFQLRGRRAA